MRGKEPTYQVEYRDQAGLHRQAWITSAHGRATRKALEHWRMSMNASFQPGGINEHLTDKYVPHISFARIVVQQTGRTVCDVHAPAFETY